MRFLRTHLLPIPCLALLLLAGTAGCHATGGHVETVCCAPSGCCPTVIEGRWKGEWVSDVNGHRGLLKARISHIEGSQYRVCYTGTFWGLLPFVFATEMDVVQDGGVARFQGSEDLGPLVGGTFSYSGSATCDEFVARFRSDEDHGTFRMSRVD
ncbi:hypothetical protein Mal4_56860 [Maioricimonas rarisocia]|uniref:Lipoprotein n=2 Tax=Maioricimonas rarisocia TaxID=2528026 RepID=A0A517ZFQ3_9PLAN|nr:hypothetical protein Mal4_56860 [Maioricimonas rarisocia]